MYLLPLEMRREGVGYNREVIILEISGVTTNAQIFKLEGSVHKYLLPNIFEKDCTILLQHKSCFIKNT